MEVGVRRERMRLRLVSIRDCAMSSLDKGGLNVREYVMQSLKDTEKNASRRRSFKCVEMVVCRERVRFRLMSIVRGME